MRYSTRANVDKTAVSVGTLRGHCKMSGLSFSAQSARVLSCCSFGLVSLRFRLLLGFVWLLVFVFFNPRGKLYLEVLVQKLWGNILSACLVLNAELITDHQLFPCHCVFFMLVFLSP